jgi:hypothetical protein
MGAKASGFKELVRDLDIAAETVVEEGKKVVGKGCLNIKKQARSIIKAVGKRGYIPHYPGSIGYNVTARSADITGEVGPDRAKLQGGLGRILEFGTVNNAPIPHMIPAADAEEPNFVRYVGELGEKLLNGQKGPDGPVNDPGGG